MTDRRGAGRREEDIEAAQAAGRVETLLIERARLLKRTNRMLTERLWATRGLIFAVFVLFAANGYGFGVVAPELRRQSDATVCAFRSVGNREAALAQSSRTRAARRTHRRSRDTFRALERETANGRTVKCRPLIRKGKR